MHAQKPVGRYIGKLSNQIRRRMDVSASKSSISGTQGRILHFILAQDGDVFQKDVEEAFNLRPATATGTLKLMEKNGIIRRESTSYDARLKRILVTEKASKMKNQVSEDVQDLEKTLVMGIPEDQLNVFFEVMEQMSKNLGE